MNNCLWHYFCKIQTVFWLFGSHLYFANFITKPKCIEEFLEQEETLELAKPCKKHIFHHKWGKSIILSLARFDCLNSMLLVLFSCCRLTIMYVYDKGIFVLLLFLYWRCFTYVYKYDGLVCWEELIFNSWCMIRMLD